DPGDSVREVVAEVGIEADHVLRGQAGLAVSRNQRQLRGARDNRVRRVISLRAIGVAVLQMNKVIVCTAGSASQTHVIIGSRPIGGEYGITTATKTSVTLHFLRGRSGFCLAQGHRTDK